MRDVIDLSLNGYTDLPDGKVAQIVTYLETTEPADWRLPTPEGAELVTAETVGLDRYRALFREIGSDWLWFSRLILSDAELQAVLAEPGRQIRIARIDGRDCGLLELEFSDPANVEVSFFGLVPSAVGRSIGRWMMGEALAICWAAPQTERVWLHTCTLDHPSALSFYMKCGFRPYRRAIEVADDPRLSGHLPDTAGVRLPLLQRSPGAD